MSADVYGDVEIYLKCQHCGKFSVAFDST